MSDEVPLGGDCCTGWFCIVLGRLLLWGLAFHTVITQARVR